MDSSLGDIALARDSLERLRARLAAQGVEAYTGHAGDRSNWPLRYSAVPEEIAAANARLKEDCPAAVADYNRGVLLELIASFSLNDAIYRLPPSITHFTGGRSAASSARSTAPRTAFSTSPTTAT